MRFAAIVTTLLVTVTSVAQDAPDAKPYVDAAQTFLEQLSGEQQTEVTLPFDSDERENWHYFPKSRPGISFKTLPADRHDVILQLLEAFLSDEGYVTAEDIRSLETVLNEMESGGGFSRDSELYWITLFGQPDMQDNWGLRYEGHHISFNWTFAGGKLVAGTPEFLGANPATVPIGPTKGLQALGDREALARKLITMFDDEQRQVAIVNDQPPREIVTGADRVAAIEENTGLKVADMAETQREAFMTLLAAYLSAQREPVRDARLDRVKQGGIDNVTFSWAGGLEEEGVPHYYRIQGAKFLVEYANTQDNANHIHTVWRDFNGDFGRDVLKEHYETADAGHGH